jgi:predicted transcriptional regulator YdeE
MSSPSEQLVQVTPFTVAGISVRTVNREEFNPASAKLPTLWQKFYGLSLATEIPAQVPGSKVYGVYSQYESDVSGFYTVTAGMSVNAMPSLDYQSTDVEGGQYLVFVTKGEMPKAVIDTWIRVWHFFEINTNVQRAYRTDFEEYRGANEIAVYIGIKN